MWGSLKFVQDKYWGAERTKSDSLFVISPPFGRVAVSWVNILERDGEMDKEEIEVIDATVSELLLYKSFGLKACSKKRLA